MSSSPLLLPSPDKPHRTRLRLTAIAVVGSHPGLQHTCLGCTEVFKDPGSGWGS